MANLTIHQHVGPDGVLKIELPPGHENSDVEVTLRFPEAKGVTPSLTPEELGWPPGFFEKFAGSLAGNQIVEFEDTPPSDLVVDR